MKTVLLTGITGFIAKRIAHDLLSRGYNVRGSLRDMSRADEVRRAVGKDATLEFVTLDLTRDEGWAEAMQGVDVLMHTASPFPLSQPDDESEVIRPAVDGTLRALGAAQKAGVTRVVLTSSMVAVMHVDRPEGHRYGPDDWTDIHHPTASAYIKSKTLAEQAAWQFCRDHPEMELTTILPGLVAGTPMDRHYGTSLEVIERLWAGKDPMVPNFGLPVVDVDDVSALHIAAVEREAAVGQRVIAADGYWMYPEMAALLADEFPNRRIATRKAPRWLLRILGLADRSIRQIIPQLDRRIEIDNSATAGLLGRDFIPGRDAILASARFIDALKG